MKRLLITFAVVALVIGAILGSFAWLASSARAAECVTPQDAMLLMRKGTRNAFDTVTPVEGSSFQAFRCVFAQDHRWPVPADSAQIYDSEQPVHGDWSHAILFRKGCVVDEFDLRRQKWLSFFNDPNPGRSCGGA